MLIRKPDADFSFDKLSKANIYSALSALKIGLDILLLQEDVRISKLLGHGGFFKAAFAQVAMAAVANADVSIMETAGEGGAFGMAVLASYMLNKKEMTLSEYLNKIVFENSKIITVKPKEQEIKMFEKYLKNYIKAMPSEQKATECF